MSSVFLCTRSSALSYPCQVSESANHAEAKQCRLIWRISASAGGLFLRALLERCDDGPEMHTLVTLGSPHQGPSFLSRKQDSLCLLHCQIAAASSAGCHNDSRCFCQGARTQRLESPLFLFWVSYPEAICLPGCKTHRVEAFAFVYAESTQQDLHHIHHRIQQPVKVILRIVCRCYQHPHLHIATTEVQLVASVLAVSFHAKSAGIWRIHTMGPKSSHSGPVLQGTAFASHPWNTPGSESWLLRILECAV